MSNKNKRNLQRKYEDSQNQTNPNIVASQQVWKAPLPPPNILNAYSSKVQEAIVLGAEEYRRHNIVTEEKISDTEAFTVKIVAITYFASTIILLFLGGLAIILNKQIAGTIMWLIGIVINIVPKILGKKDNKHK